LLLAGDSTLRRAAAVLDRIELDRRRLRAEVLLEELNPVEAEERAFLPPGGRARLKRSAYLLRLAGLDLDRQDGRRAQYLRAAAEIFENIAGGPGVRGLGLRPCHRPLPVGAWAATRRTRLS
jgi:hypothetical protein